MSVADQLLAGLGLTITGMVTVFLLLTFMVLVIGWMSKLAHRLAPTSRPHPLSSFDGPEGSLDPTVVTVITAAVHRYRQNRR